MNRLDLVYGGIQGRSRLAFPYKLMKEQDYFCSVQIGTFYTHSSPNYNYTGKISYVAGTTWLEFVNCVCFYFSSGQTFTTNIRQFKYLQRMHNIYFGNLKGN